MKKISTWTKCISFLLVFAFVFGMTTIGLPIRAEGETSLPEELNNYTRITMEDLGLAASPDDSGTIYTSYAEGVCTLQTLNKTYLDVDVNFNGSTDSTYFHILHKADWTEFVRIVRYEAGMSVYEAKNSASNNIWIPNIPANEFFNLKIAMDVVTNTGDPTLSDISIAVWIDDVVQGSYTFTAKESELMRSCVSASAEKPLSLRTPKEHFEEEEQTNYIVIPEELKEYTRLTAADLGIAAEENQTGTAYTAYAEGKYDPQILDKAFLDVDINFGGSTDSTYLHVLHKADWTEFVRIVHYGSGMSVYEAKDTTNHNLWLADVPVNEFFNLKVSFDIVANTENAALSDITLQVWINNSFEGTFTYTGTLADLEYACVSASAEKPLALRTPVKKPEAGTPNVTEALKGYTRVTFQDFAGITVDESEAGTTFTSEVNATYTGETFHKTYLDFDVDFNGASTNYLHFLAQGAWANYKRLGWMDGGLILYDPLNTSAGSVYLQKNLGQTTDGFFNVKIRTDIVQNAEDSVKEDVTLQLWINDTYAGEATWTEASHNRNVFYIYIGSGSMTLRIPTEESTPPETTDPTEPEEPTVPSDPSTPDISDALAGYTRITLNDFDGLTASKSEQGTAYAVEARGTYTGESLNKTYLDFDINFNGTTTNYIHVLAKDAWEKYKRFAWTENGVSLWDPNGDTAKSVFADSTYGVTTDGFINVKIRTDIIPNAVDPANEDVLLQLWINDEYVGECQWTEAQQSRNLLYIYVGSGTLTLRTPVTEDDPSEEEIPVPEISEALKDYIRVTPRDFAMLDSTFVHGWIEGNWMGYEYPESLNKTYLDMDIAFCKDDNFQNTIRYLSMDGWQSLQIGIVGEELLIFETSTNAMLYKIALSDYGIAADTFFNMKLSADIIDNSVDSSKKDVTLILWINGQIVTSAVGTQRTLIKGCSTIGNILGVYLPNEGQISIRTPEGTGEDNQLQPTQQPDPSFKTITFESFAISNGTYGYKNLELSTQGNYILSLNRTVFSGDFCFSNASGADFRYGGNGNPWLGLRFWTTGDGKLYMQDTDEKTEKFTFHPKYAGTQLIDCTFNMKISIEFVDADQDGRRDDVKLGVWFNNYLYKDSFIELIDYASELGKSCSIFAPNPNTWIRITNDPTVYTGVDFTLFGYTRNWKKEMGLAS